MQWTVLALLLIIALLLLALVWALDPETQRVRRLRRQWKKERLDLNPALRRRS